MSYTVFKKNRTAAEGRHKFGEFSKYKKSEIYVL